jgi:hypothetical protein
LPWRHDYDAENTIEATFMRCGRHHTRPACRPRHPRQSAARCGRMAFDCTQTVNATFPGRCVVTSASALPLLQCAK